MMALPDFWLDKERAHLLVKEYQMLKEGGGGDPHDAGNATLAILRARAATMPKTLRACFVACMRAMRQKGGRTRAPCT